ncbi:MAG TPA: hypothetical protein DIW23_11420 [Anaerolineae bacterium]|nr:hypothetical protein [Anaerolineae bacterium]HRJ76591.1 hypothetical protein [Anaerolineales bacterium]
MARKRRSRKNQSNFAQIREKIAEKTIWAIAILVLVLIISLLVFVFRIGESMYPVWMVEYRNPIIGILLTIIFIIIIASPLIVEANSNPRRLSGPGKRPDYW